MALGVVSHVRSCGCVVVLCPLRRAGVLRREVRLCAAHALPALSREERATVQRWTPRWRLAVWLTFLLFVGVVGVLWAMTRDGK